MFINLPDELIYKIVNNLESTDIYHLTLTSQYLNKMKFQAILTALMFKNYWGIYKEDLLDFKNWGYTLGNYLSDLSEVNNYSRFNYEKKQSIYLEEKKMYRFNHKQEDLFEKKDLMNVAIHSIYRIPFMSYRLLKIQKSPILALIY